MGTTAQRQGGGGDVAEVRLRLDAGDAKRLKVAAEVRGISVSALVAEALRPHLAFRLPDVPEVFDTRPTTGPLRPRR